VLNLRHAHGAQRKLLQVRQQRKHERVFIKTELAAEGA